MNKPSQIKKDIEGKQVNQMPVNFQLLFWKLLFTLSSWYPRLDNGLGFAVIILSLLLRVSIINLVFIVGVVINLLLKQMNFYLRLPAFIWTHFNS